MTRKILATIGATLAIGVASFVSITSPDVNDLRGGEQTAITSPSGGWLELRMRSARL